MSHDSLSRRFQWLLECTSAKEKQPNQFMGHCPAHDDGKPSLSLSCLEDRILLHCFAGCTLEKVLTVLGIEKSDLFEKSTSDSSDIEHTSRNAKLKEKLRYNEVERYEYQQKDGTPQFCVIRQETFDSQGKRLKNFLQSGYRKDGSLTWNMQGTQRLPYQLPKILEAIEAGQPILFVEGEKDVHTAEKLGFTATTIPNGAKSNGGEEVADECLYWLTNADVVLCPDNDKIGQLWQKMIGEKIVEIANNVSWLDLPDLQEKEDLTDWVAKGGSQKQLRKLVQQAPEFKPQEGIDKDVDSFSLMTFSLGELLNMNLPKRECLLGPWLPEKGLAMVFAQRGIGKTWFAQQVAICVAAGIPFLNWQTPKARRVLFIDGEMPATDLKERFNALVESSPINEPSDLYLKILAADFQKLGMPNLSSEEGQKELEPLVAEAELIVVDSISTLVRNGRENEAESWVPIQNWALKQRARGKTILFIHHAGKGGEQRGSSKKEDVLDTVIQLKSPIDYSPNEGAHYEVHFSKARGFYGKDADPFDLQLQTDTLGKLQWTSKDLRQRNYEKTVEYSSAGLKQVEIAEALGISKQAVHKHIKKAKAGGL